MMFRVLICIGVFVASLHANMVVFFSSENALKGALVPLQLEEIAVRISPSVQFQYDPNVGEKKIIPLRNPGTENLLKTEVYKTQSWTVFYPETPRVPHHLVIALNRSNAKGVADIDEKENAELFATIKKITEIYKTIAIQGFVIAQYDTPQQGHNHQYVVELIPHLPGFDGMKNLVDKADCNRYVLFRTANLSYPTYKIGAGDILKQAEFWQAALKKEQAPLSENKAIAYPFTRNEAYQSEANEMIYHQLLEILQDRGGKVAKESTLKMEMPTAIPTVVQSATSAKCVFCDDDVSKRQLIYEYKDVSLFYNIRKGAKPGSCFLILPKRHTQKVHGLTSSEVLNIGIMRRALVQVLKETHPECEVVIYTQDDPSVGQTVFHSHEQVVAIDPKTIALTWTMASLHFAGNISDEERIKVLEEFHVKLEQKLKEATPMEKSA